ncbi:NAD(P)-binding protein [Saccharata proteae CBS 121410]|uniref:NAD(P)-binding protein n=1 Tax=Saccharata proteae CBS 121410 TaxID=1314787 RepID=A0A9P4M2B4_9PEZI|nr:NAD(P)-binding protein [Saccharata proteae CBS 121410]
MKTALVTGATGLLGHQVVKEFESRGWTVVGTGLSRAKPPSVIKLDILDTEAVESVLDEVKPDVVVHCAANRFPDFCSKQPSAARAINATATHALTTLTAARDIFLLYISTDYVFSGLPGEAPYAPSSPPSPANTYGQTKLEGEQAVLEAATRKPGLAAVLRVPILYGACPDNDYTQSAVNVLVSQIQKAAAATTRPGQASAAVKMDDYAQRYPTNTADVARVCFDVCALYGEKGDGAAAELPAVLHFSSEDRRTKYQMCRDLAEILDLPIDGIEPHRPTEEEERAVRRPYDCHLDTRETRELGIDVSTVGFKNWWRKELGAFRH